MTYIGDSINTVLAVMVVLSVLGTAGVTVYFQHATTDVKAENQRLEAENERLRSRLSAVRAELNATRERLARLNGTTTATASGARAAPAPSARRRPATAAPPAGVS
ncbi:MAG: hypothetical protein ABEJ42_00305 [Halobacteriaceae archaeon]